MLKQRGLIINDEGMALKKLASISYFRLASYWKVFEIDETTHQFASGTRIEDVISLYTFDRELRSIIFTAIQDIEVALRTRIIHFFSLSHGAFWFMQLLCSSWSCMEPPLSSHASATKATASYMGRYPAHTTDEIYAQLCTLLYLEQSITPNSHIKDRLLSLLNAYPHTITRQMGFPRGWENEPLWQEPN